MLNSSPIHFYVCCLEVRKRFANFFEVRHFALFFLILFTLLRWHLYFSSVLRVFSRRKFCLSLSLFLISFFSSEDIHGLWLCLTSIVLRGIHSLAIVRNLSVKLIHCLFIENIKKASLYPLPILNVRPPPMDSISHVIYNCANMNLSNTMIRTLLVNMKKYFPFVTQFNIRPNIKDLIDHEAFICTWLNFNITIILIFKSSPLPGFSQIDTGTFIYTIDGL